jgi:hypothetical protein
MENLWPDLKIRSQYKDATDLHDFLAEQARYLQVATNGLLHASSEMTMRNEQISFSLFMWPNGRQHMRYELLRIRSESKLFPLVVESYHLDDQLRYQKVISINGLKETLKSIFENSKTIRIIHSLASEALDEGSENYLQQVGREQGAEKEPRPLAIGNLIKEKSGLEFSQVSFLGVSGFLSVDAIQSLARKPESNGSSVQQLNDQFVVTLEFIGSVKALLTVSELERLQEEAKRVLNARNN